MLKKLETVGVDLKKLSDAVVRKSKARSLNIFCI